MTLLYIIRKGFFNPPTPQKSTHLMLGKHSDLNTHTTHSPIYKIFFHNSLSRYYCYPHAHDLYPI